MKLRSKYSPSKMSSKQSPSKLTLGMIKGKAITMSVPAIRYHASDDELEELYINVDDDEQLIPESEKICLKPYARKNHKSTSDDTGDCDSTGLVRRSNSMDENLSESPTSDPWKVLTDIKGKITKTFEGKKLMDIKNKEEKKKSKKHKDTNSTGDHEDQGDITPTEESLSEKQEKKIASPVLRKRTKSSKFIGFSFIKTGLKVEKSKEDTVNNVIESAEIAYQNYEPNSQAVQEDDQSIYTTKNCYTVLEKNIQLQQPSKSNTKNTIQSESEHVFQQLKCKLIYQIILLVLILWCCYCIKLPKYLMGICAGIITTIVAKKIFYNISTILLLPTNPKSVSIQEVPAVEEHSFVEKFEGWLNELPYDYKPDNYHLARTMSVFLSLEAELLQVFETRARIPKRAVWDEPLHAPKFTKKRVYCLNDAKVELLPKGLIRRRRWSKKYPICIILGKDALKECVHIDTSSDDDPIVHEDDDKIIIEEDETDDDISQSKDTRDVFEDCRDEEEDMIAKLFIFARTDRQKEDWFRYLSNASCLSDSKRSSISSAKDSFSGTPSPVCEPKNSSPSSPFTEITATLAYEAYMSKYIADSSAPVLGIPSSPPVYTDDSSWINAIIGRILYDMHNCPDFTNVIQDKIQRKLSSIRLPYFMESLTVSEVIVGQGAPVIHSSTKPIIDCRGVWIDLEMSYEGSLTMKIETKLNLMKLKRDKAAPDTNETGGDKTRSPMFDSDVEDSPETSTEDEDSAPLSAPASSKENTPTQSSGKKFLNMVDKLASNKYFQHATDLSYVRRAMEGVSNTEIRLMVSLSSIEGCLAINIPPPPTDRFWYGFHPVPKINLTAKPAVGERSLNINYITKIIEAKLLREFEKVVVIPNMDDLLIPLCPNYPYAT